MLLNEGNVLPLDVKNFQSIAPGSDLYADRGDERRRRQRAHVRRSHHRESAGRHPRPNRDSGDHCASQVCAGRLETSRRRADPATTAQAFGGRGGAGKRMQRDLALVCARDFETEGADRAAITLPDEQDEMISAIVRANPRTIVVLNYRLHGAGQCLGRYGAGDRAGVVLRAGMMAMSSPTLFSARLTLQENCPSLFREGVKTWLSLRPNNIRG